MTIDPFLVAYMGFFGALLGWVAHLVDKPSRRLLFGLCSGLIAAVGMPFVQNWLL